MSPWVHVAPLFVVGATGLVVGLALGAGPRCWASLTRRQPEDPRVAAVIAEAQRFGACHRHGLRVRHTANGWWVGARRLNTETEARAEIRRVLG